MANNDGEEGDAHLGDADDHSDSPDDDASQPHLEVLRAPPPLPAYFLDPERTPVRAVARIEAPSPTMPGQVTVGTGVLIAPRLVLTCQHVLPTDEDVRRATFDFNYSSDVVGSWGAERRYQADPQGLVWRSAHWDCLMLELEAAAEQHNFPIAWSRSLPLEGAWVNVLHHPQGLEKGFSRGQIHSASEGEVTYLLPTFEGSSGAPVCNETWEMVALHRGSQSAGQSGLKVGIPLHTIFEEMPSPVRARVQVAQAAAARPARRRGQVHHLPIPPTPLLGREAELATLTALLGREDVRLVTVTGPGGVGKTRLAQQVALDLATHFSSGVYYVSLAPLESWKLVASTIAGRLGLSEGSSQTPEQQIRDYLADKRLMLVLDNFEHVLPAAIVLSTLRDTCAHVKVVVTSRQALHLSGEQSFPLAPLPVPPRRSTQRLVSPTGEGELVSDDEVEALCISPAGALLLARARLAQPDFQVTRMNASALAEICRRLDGLPLALELAAARIPSRPPAALLADFDQDSILGSLAKGPRDAPERQQTLQAAIAWSYQLLTPAEQRLFRRLAVFSGGCRQDEAKRICTGGGETRLEPLGLDVATGISSLVDKHLLRRLDESVAPLDPIEFDLIAAVGRLPGLDLEREPRYGFLQTIQAYTLQQLEVSGEGEHLRQQHALVYLALAQEGEPALRGKEELVWLDRLERELDNFRAALDWTQERGQIALGLQLAGALYWFWGMHGHLREGGEKLDTLLAAAGFEGVEDEHVSGSHTSGSTLPDTVVARAFMARGYLSFWQGKVHFARSLFQEGLHLLSTDLDPLYTAARRRTVRLYLLGGLSSCAMALSDPEEFAEYSRDALALAYQLKDDYITAALLAFQSYVVRQMGDLEQADTLWQEGVRVGHALDNLEGNAVLLVWFADLDLQQGKMQPALTHTRQALAIHWQRRSPGRISECLVGLSVIAAAAHLGARSAKLLGAADALGGMIGLPDWVRLHEEEWSHELVTGLREILRTARAEMGPDQWDQAYIAGQKSPLLDIIAKEVLGPWEGVSDFVETE